MDKRLAIDTAIKIANKTAPEKSLGLEFRAVSVLSSRLVNLYGTCEEHVDGYSAGDIEDALMSLVVRQSHSPTFRAKIEDGRKKVLRHITMSPRLLGDIKYWDLLSHEDRVETCHRIMKEINVVFRSHEALPPVLPPRVQWTYNNAEKSYIDEDRNIQSYVRTVWADPKEILGTDVIWVNTHKSSRFDDPFAVLAGMYGEYIPLIQRKIGHICNTFFSSSNGLIDHDIELMDTVRNEAGFVDPYLDRIHSAQFTTSLIEAEKTAFAKGLKSIIDQEADRIPVRQPRSETLIHRAKVLAIGILNFNHE